jgi:hypothetical protein
VSVRYKITAAASFLFYHDGRWLWVPAFVRRDDVINKVRPKQKPGLAGPGFFERNACYQAAGL